jgi:hypothetical protein
MDTKDKYTKKLEEYIAYLRTYFINTDKVRQFESEIAALKAEMEKEDTDKLKDELIKFKKWFESLPPASKFGGSYWIHNLTDAGLINIYLSKTQ